jgi:YgiT-type zinc finger domain-containing protein
MPDADADTRAKEKECPVCFENMHRKPRKLTERIPGTGQTVTRDVEEWECPECSYEEEVDEDD